MKNIFSKITGFALGLAMAIGVGIGISQNVQFVESNAVNETATLTFTKACGGSGTDDKGNTWTVTSDSAESTYEDTRGIHYGTSKVNVSYVKLTSSAFTKDIKKVVVYAADANSTAKIDVKVGGNTFGEQSGTLSGTKADYTFEPTTAQSTTTFKGAVEVNISRSSAKKAIYVKSIVVTYDKGEDKKVSSISLNTDNVKKTFDVGETFTSSGLVVTAIYEDESQEEVTDYQVSSPDMSSAGTKTVTVTYSEKTATYDITVQAASLKKFALVESASDLEIGAKYLIGSGSDGQVYFLGNTQNTNNRSAVAMTVSEGLVSFTSSTAEIITLGGSAGSYTLYANSSNASGYLYAANSSNNHLKTRDENSDANSEWTITFTDDKANVKANGTFTRNTLKANTSNNPPIFSCYSYSADTQVRFYKEVPNYGTVDSIASTQPTTKEYYQGQSLDLTGAVVTASTTSSIPFNATKKCTFDPANGAILSTVGEQTVTVTYAATNDPTTTSGQNVTTTFTVNVLENPITVTGVTITNPASSPVAIGAETIINSTAQLAATVNYSGTEGTGEVTWSTSDASVVSVDNTGKAKFLKDGTATITATSVENATKSGSVVYNVSGLKGASVNSALTVADVLANAETGDILEKEVFIEGYIVDFTTYKTNKFAMIADDFEEGSTQLEFFSYSKKFDVGVLSSEYIVGSKVVGFGKLSYYESGSLYELCDTATDKLTIKKIVTEPVTELTQETAPTKVNYKPGETFDPTGMEFNVVREHSTTTLAYASTLEGVSFNPSLTTPLTEADTKVTMTYAGKTLDINITVAKVLDAITVDESSTAEDEYFEGAKFNPTGLVLKLDYAAPTEDATVAYNETTKGDFGFNPSLDTALAPSDNKVTISYGGKSVDMPITVTAKAVSTVTIKTDATKKAYYVGDNFDPAGLVVTVTYNNSDVEDVTYSETNKADFTFTPATFTSAGNVDVAVTYKSVAAGNVAVTVTAVELVSIAVKTNPTKTSYLVDEQLDLTGLVLTATYNNGTQNDVTEGYKADPVDMHTEGTKTVTVKYGGKSTTFEIVVSAKVILNSIEVVSNPTKTSYFVGETFSSEGLVIKATYSDSTFKNVTDYTLSTPDMSTAGTKTITVTYVEESITKTTTFDIQVVAIAVQSILVKTQPTKTVYTVGDTFSAAGLVIEATNNDGSKRDLADTEYQLSTPDMSTAGVKTVTVTYAEGITTSFDITVNAPVVITNLEIVTNPSKMEYVIGEKFDMTGLVLKATYSDGTTVQPVSGFTCDAPEKFSNAGVYKITFSFEGKDVSINVTVKEQSRVVGCGGSVIAASAILSLTALAGAALLLLKKKEN